MRSIFGSLVIGVRPTVVCAAVGGLQEVLVKSWRDAGRLCRMALRLMGRSCHGSLWAAIRHPWNAVGFICHLPFRDHPRRWRGKMVAGRISSVVGPELTPGNDCVVKRERSAGRRRPMCVVN